MYSRRCDWNPHRGVKVMSIDDNVVEQAQAILNQPGADKRKALAAVLRLLAKWRSTLINNTLATKQGTEVHGGPFAGLKFVRNSTEGCNAPKLLGSYERELHPAIARIAAAPYDLMIDIGCAEGYYAVGLARLMPGLRVLACDTDAKAQAACRRMAEENGVAGRVSVQGQFAGADFAAHAGKRVLVFCDIEGAEKDLLDPTAYPALKRMDVLVECHDCFTPGLSVEIARRFEPTHTVERIDRGGAAADLPQSFADWNDLDRLLATWEWRTGPTPWLFMRVKSAA